MRSVPVKIECGAVRRILLKADGRLGRNQYLCNGLHCAVARVVVELCREPALLWERQCHFMATGHSSDAVPNDSTTLLFTRVKQHHG